MDSEHFYLGLDLYKKKDYKEAIKHFALGKQENDNRCAYILGTCYYEGKGVEEDKKIGKDLITKCINYLEQDAVEGLDGANKLIFVAYTRFDFLKDDKKALNILLKMHQIQDKEFDEECFQALIDFYRKEEASSKNDKKVLELCEEYYSKYESYESIYYLATYYIYLNQNDKIAKAFKLCQKGYNLNKIIFYDYLLMFYTGINYRIGQKYIDYLEATKIINEIENEYSNMFHVEISLWKAIVYFFKTNNLNETKKILGKIEFKSSVDINCLKDFWMQVYKDDDFSPNKFTTESDIGRYESLNVLLYETSLKISDLNFEQLSPYYFIYCFYNSIISIKSLLHLSEKAENEFISKIIFYINEGAKKNDPYSLWILSQFYFEGNFVNKNEKIGIDYLVESVRIMGTFSESLNKLARCYEYGIGINKNIENAIYYYRKSYELNDGKRKGSNLAKLNLAYLLKTYSRSCFDKEEAVKIISEYNFKTDPDDNITLYINKGKDPQKYFWFLNLYYSNGNTNYAFDLGYCYQQGIGTSKNIDKAVEIFKNDISYNKSISLWLLGNIYYQGVGKEKNIDIAYEYFKKSISCNNSWFNCYTYTNLFEICIERNSKHFNPKEALDYLIISTEDNLENCERANNCFLLASFYNFNEFGLEDKKKAKEYYELAYKLGVNCSYALEALERDEKTFKFYKQGIELGKKQGLYDFKLEKFAKEYAREEYCKTTPKGINNAIKALELPKCCNDEKLVKIEIMLKDNFDVIWDYLKDDSKKSMITALYCYSNFIELGYDVYSTLDFSPVVNGLSKAFEIVLKDFFLTKYLKYLKNHNISYKEFIDEGSLTQLPFINAKVINNDNEPEIVYSYAEDLDNKNFSLGQVYFIITSGQNNRFLNRFVNQKNISSVATRKLPYIDGRVNGHIVDFFDEIFKEDAFPFAKRKDEIANYLIDFADDVRTIKLRRNSGSHESAMKAEDAELCADYLIRIKKLIYSFLIKVKSEER